MPGDPASCATQRPDWQPSHAPEQALSQHKPVTQFPELHSLASTQGCEFWLLGMHSPVSQR